ncbi:hypothetical protein TNCV_1777181 [Trichonephila clavipes]|nr:hypothetical protein TNCV_1777181 [Trichonephila clavipes]
MLLDKKCRKGSEAWLPPHAFAQVSALRLNRNSSLKITRLQLLHSSLPEVGKNPIDAAHDVGSVVGILIVVGF